MRKVEVVYFELAGKDWSKLTIRSAPSFWSFNHENAEPESGRSFI